MGFQLFSFLISCSFRKILLSTVIYLPYRVSGSTLTAVGRSRLLARWPGTLSRILSGIQWRINHDANDAMAWGPPLKGAPRAAV